MWEGELGGDFVRDGVTAGLDADGVRVIDGGRDALRVCVFAAEGVRVRDAADVPVRVADAAALPVRVVVGPGVTDLGGVPEAVAEREGVGGGDCREPLGVVVSVGGGLALLDPLSVIAGVEEGVGVAEGDALFVEVEEGEAILEWSHLPHCLRCGGAM